MSHERGQDRSRIVARSIAFRFLRWRPSWETTLWAETFPLVHARWKDAWQAGGKPKHPLAPLIRAWLERPRQIEPETRSDPIMPAPFIHVRRSDRRAGSLFQGAGHLRADATGQTYLPGFAPGEPHGPRQPVLPLALYDLGVGEGGRGAPLALRMFIEPILAVPVADRLITQRKGPTTFEPNPVSLRQLAEALFGRDTSGKLNYRPGKHWPRLMRAFEALESNAARVPWEDPKTGIGSAMRVVSVVEIPRDGYRLGDRVVFHVRLPPGSEKGPLIDRPALRVAGLNSAPAYRLMLGLSFLWADPGKLTVRIKGKGPFRQVRDERRYERYASVTDSDLVAMAYPVGSVVGAKYRKRLHRAKQALAFLERIGFCKALVVGSGRAIMPGSEWTGWSENKRP